MNWMNMKATILLISVTVMLSDQLLAQPLTKGGFVLNNLSIPYDEIKSGGPSKNQIPALHYPDMIEPDQAKYLNDDDQVLGINIKGESSAYPIKILDWHEIVNDKIGDQHFIITYCPLCASGMAFESMFDRKVLTFQVSGLLYNSDVLMYDTQTESLWSQLASKAVSGKYAGTALKMIPITQTSWRDWKKMNPETKVLSVKTGHFRNYGELAYAGYRQSGQLMFPVDTMSNQLNPKELVFGLEFNGQFKAYPVAKLIKEKSQFEDRFGSDKLYLAFDHKEEKLTVKDKTDKPIPVVKLYWFAWFAFHPKTIVFDGR